MNTKLRWCVGKFTHPRNSTQLLHFMPLQDFSVNESLDICQLFFLRMLHMKNGQGIGSNDHQLEKWMEGTGVKPIAELAFTLLKQRRFLDTPPCEIAEFHPGIGLTYEYLKVLIKQESQTSTLSDGKPVRYTCYADPSLLNKFRTLHVDSGDRFQSSFQDLQAARTNPHTHVGSDTRRLAIYNHNQWVREYDDYGLSLDQFLRQSHRHALLALRVTMSPKDEMRTTIKRRRVRLPSMHRVIDRFQLETGYWYYRLIAHIDDDFFLPSHHHSTGLLLLYNDTSVYPLTGFKPVDKGAGNYVA